LEIEDVVENTNVNKIELNMNEYNWCEQWDTNAWEGRTGLSISRHRGYGSIACHNSLLIGNGFRTIKAVSIAVNWNWNISLRKEVAKF